MGHPKKGSPERYVTHPDAGDKEVRKKRVVGPAIRPC